MKTAPKSQGLHQVKTNNRWKWMAGATAASAAAATNAQAGSTVTVNLSNNYIDYLQGNNLNANIFGNGNIFSFSTTRHSGRASEFGTASFRIHTYKMLNGGGKALAEFDSRSATASVRTNGGLSTRQHSFGSRHDHHHSTPSGSGYSTHTTVPGKAKVKFTIPIWFMDPSVNGDALTEGFLSVTANAMGATTEGSTGVANISLDSFTYMAVMQNGVPEGGSTLALLAMGAGGVIAFRGRKKAASAAEVRS